MSSCMRNGWRHSELSLVPPSPTAISRVHDERYQGCTSQKEPYGGEGRGTIGTSHKKAARASTVDVLTVIRGTS